MGFIVFVDPISIKLWNPPIRWRGEYDEHIDGFVDVEGRNEWNSVANTLTSGDFNPTKERKAISNLYL